MKYPKYSWLNPLHSLQRLFRGYMTLLRQSLHTRQRRPSLPP